MPKLSKAKLASNKRWDDKNKDKKRLYRYRSYARKYVRELASDEDLDEIQQLIDERREKSDH